MEKSLKEYLAELTNKYIPEKIVKENLTENHLVTVASRNLDLLNDFILEFKPFDFELINDYDGGFRYFSKNLTQKDAETLEKVIKAKINIEREQSYDETESYLIAIESNFNQISVSNYYNTTKEIKDKEYNETRLYYARCLVFEERLLQTDFRTDFCNEVINLVKNHTNYNELVNSGKISESLEDFVYDNYDTAFKITYKNKLNLQAYSNRDLYMVVSDSSLYKMDNETKQIVKYVTNRNSDKNIHDSVNEILETTYNSFNLIKPIHSIKEMGGTAFKLELDKEKFTSDDSMYSIGDRFSTDYEDRFNNNLASELKYIIQKNSINHAEITASFELHKLLVLNNANINNYKDLFKTFFNDNRFPLENGIESLKEIKKVKSTNGNRKPSM